MTFQHQQTELQQGLAGDQKNAMKIPLQAFFSSLLSKGSDEPPRHKIWSLLGLVIIGLFGGLYFFHVTAQQEYLTKRNFRILESWNQELTNKIQSFESIFQFPSQHRVPTLIQHPDGPEQQVGLFSNPKNAAPLSPDELNNMKWWDVSCIRGEKPDLKDQKFNFFF